MRGQFYLIVQVISLFYCLGQQNQTKALCYSGSNLYQQLTQNCNSQNPSYTGEWYCAKIELCEAFISESRQCVVTRGCATQSQCRYSPSSSGIYDSTGLQVAGMSITVTCCLANNFANDDTIAIDYTQICNSAPTGFTYPSLGMLVGATLILLTIFNYQ